MNMDNDISGSLAIYLWPHSQLGINGLDPATSESVPAEVLGVGIAEFVVGWPPMFTFLVCGGTLQAEQ